jgi:isocitrate lyase
MVFAPYADLIWLETKKPDLEQARSFARKIREKYPGKWFVYNLSPSFNWASHGFSGKSQSYLIFIFVEADNFVQIWISRTSFGN